MELKTDDNCEEDIIQKTWKKIEQTVKTTALGDGLASGQNTNYQNYFDKGYYEGFRNGYVIGKYKGLLFAKNCKSTNHLPEDEILTDAKKAWCQICKTEEFTHKSVEEAVAIQTEITNMNLSVLHSLYSTKFDTNIELPQTL